jgi:glutamine synthetase
VANHWIAGLLENAAASCLMTTPPINGYKRFLPHQLAPNSIQWGTDNRGAMVRALLYPGDSASRVENRVADSSANPYYALAAQILSGLDGITRGVQAPPPSETPYAGNAPALPTSLIAAIDAFERSPLFAEHLGTAFTGYLSHIKRAEWERYLRTVSEWEQAEYFNLF